MYDPNQPRIPEGHHGGGRWTRGGYGYLSDVGALPPPSLRDDETPRAPDGWDRQPDDLYLPSDLDRMRPARGDQYARGGRVSTASQPISGLGGPNWRGVGRWRGGVRGLVAPRDGPGRQTVIEFRAREVSSEVTMELVSSTYRTCARLIERPWRQKSAEACMPSKSSSTRCLRIRHVRRVRTMPSTAACSTRHSRTRLRRWIS